MNVETQALSELLEETQELGAMLKAIADAEPSGTPSEAAAAAFLAWTAEAGPGSRRPDYFEDVRGNYDIAANSNRDLSELFGFLETHLEIPEYEAPADEPPKTFITLPLLGT